MTNKFTKGTIRFVKGTGTIYFQGSAKDCKELAEKYNEKFCGYFDGRKHSEYSLKNTFTCKNSFINIMDK